MIGTIVQAIFPVFALAALGYALAAFNVLKERDVEGLTRFVFSAAMPVLLFNALATASVSLSIDWPFLLAFYAVSLLIFVLGILIGRAQRKLSPAEQTLFGLGCCYSNLILVGLPIISGGLGEQAILPLLVLASVQNLIFFPLVSLVAHPSEPGARLLGRVGKAVGRVLANPMVSGMLLGLAFKALSIELPALIQTPVGMLAQVAIPSSLVALGASLHRYEATRLNTRVLTIAVFKLALQPVLMWVLAQHILHLPPLLVAVAVMAAGMPTAVNAYLLTQQMGAGQKTVAGAIWITTLAAVVTQAILLFIFIPYTQV